MENNEALQDCGFKRHDRDLASLKEARTFAWTDDAPPRSAGDLEDAARTWRSISCGSQLSSRPCIAARELVAHCLA